VGSYSIPSWMRRAVAGSVRRAARTRVPVHTEPTTSAPARPSGDRTGGPGRPSRPPTRGRRARRRRTAAGPRRRSARVSR
jgi:hypothetical protein